MEESYIRFSSHFFTPSLVSLGGGYMCVYCGIHTFVCVCVFIVVF